LLKLGQLDFKINKMAGFGQFIKNERERRDWTQTEFGNQIGINTSAICRIENGTQKFSISKLETLSEILEIDNQKINDLFFADKFAKEALKYKCSESVFSVAENNATYFRNSNVKQAKLNFENE
jgi:transcriptional regulator with XRE-family HTH domain